MPDKGLSGFISILDNFREISILDPGDVILSITTPTLPYDMEACRIAKEIKTLHYTAPRRTF